MLVESVPTFESVEFGFDRVTFKSSHKLDKAGMAKFSLLRRRTPEKFVP